MKLLPKLRFSNQFSKGSKLGCMVAAAFFANTLVIDDADAKTRNITVKANKSTTIFTFSLFDPRTCGSGGTPKIKIIQASKGKLSTVVKSNTMNSGTCKGRRVKGIQVIYRPNSGFRGADSGTVRFTFPQFDDDSGVKIYDARFRITVQ